LDGRESWIPVLHRTLNQGGDAVLYTLVVVLLVLWLLGMVTSTTMGGVLHLLLVVALIVVLVRLVSGRAVA
jgi:hypothetical protein